MDLLLLSAAGMASAFGQQLPPDDPAIVANLGVWFKDAANTFDAGTGVWADSSGNDRHATPVGEVNVTSPVTYVAPTLATISGGAFSVDDVSSVHFTSTADDLLAANDLNGDVGLGELTIFVAYNVENPGGNQGLTRPVGIGSIAATQANPGDHFNLGSDPSIRKDNGQIGSGTYSQAFPLQTTFIRTTRMSATAIDDWFNTDGTAQSVLNVPGVSFTTSVDDFYLGDVRAGTTAVPGFGASLSLADFDIIQALAYSAALSDEQVAGVNEWLTNNLSGGSGGATKLAFTQIEVSDDGTNATLTWRSRPGKTYAVDLSTDLKAGWQEIDDEVASDGAGTTSATVPTFIDPQPDPPHTRVFYRVREVQFN